MIFEMAAPAKRWSRLAELILAILSGSFGLAGLVASTLLVLSSTCQVRPPSIERRKPTPGDPVEPATAGLKRSISPVPTKMIDWLGSLLRPKTAMLPVLRLLVGPKSVSGMYVGPWGSLVRKLDVFQTPPEAPLT